MAQYRTSPIQDLSKIPLETTNWVKVRGQSAIVFIYIFVIFTIQGYYIRLGFMVRHYVLTGFKLSGRPRYIHNTIHN